MEPLQFPCEGCEADLEEGVPFQFFAKTPDGRSVLIGVRATTLVFDLNQKTQNRLGIPTEPQNLIYDGESLQDNFML